MSSDRGRDPAQGWRRLTEAAPRSRTAGREIHRIRGFFGRAEMRRRRRPDPPTSHQTVGGRGR
jgi:hypothetical protein